MPGDRKVYIAIALAVLASFVVSTAYYPFSPDPMVTHWNAAGVPDGYMSRFWGLYLLPLMNLGLAVLLLLIPSIDPLKANFRHFRIHYDRFVLALLAFMLAVQVVVVLWNAGLEISFNIIMPIGAGLLFVYLGFVIEHVKRNWIMGIRTPWTLSSDVVWERTHRLGARLLKMSGAIAILGAFAGTWAWLFILAPLGITAVWTVVYSYTAYRSVEASVHPAA